MENTAESLASNEEAKEEVAAQGPTKLIAKKVEKGDVIQAPPWCRFQINEIIPLKGWNFRCIGYSPLFEPVFQCVGPTGKTEKELTPEQVKATKDMIRALAAKPRPEAKPATESHMDVVKPPLTPQVDG